MDEKKTIYTFASILKNELSIHLSKERKKA
jgi:hypothetical protein